MIYEMRHYDVLPGRMAALHARFEAHTLRLFERHGIKPLGFWETMIGTRDVLNYLVTFENLAARERSWNGLASDETWKRVRDESHRDGFIISRARNEIWQPTSYSVLQ